MSIDFLACFSMISSSLSLLASCSWRELLPDLAAVLERGQYVTCMQDRYFMSCLLPKGWVEDNTSHRHCVASLISFNAHQVQPEAGSPVPAKELLQSSLTPKHGLSEIDVIGNRRHGD